MDADRLMGFLEGLESEDEKQRRGRVAVEDASGGGERIEREPGARALSGSCSGYAYRYGYACYIGSIRPLNCTPKNNVIVGVRK